jgi:hypothetical protein
MLLSNQTLDLRYKKSVKTVEVLANATELAKALMRSVVGNEIADTINDQPLTDGVYGQLIAAELRKQLSPKTGI